MEFMWATNCKASELEPFVLVVYEVIIVGMRIDILRFSPCAVK